MLGARSRKGKAALVVLPLLLACVLAAPAAAGNGKLLLVGPTLWPGLVPSPGGGTDSGVSVEQAQGELMGEGIDVVDAAAFTAMTTAQIAAYDAIVMGDPGCGIHEPPAVVLSRASEWGPAVTGNVIVLGAAPVYDYVGTGVLDPRAVFVIDAALSYALGDHDHTGAYIDLSCYYRSALPGTHASMLDPFGDFTVTGGCAATAHLDLPSPPAPPFDLLSDYMLSNWWACSAYETFDAIPSGFESIASANGFPYIVARGTTGTTPVDRTAPTITITTPPDGATYALGDVVAADYTCADDSGVAACDGDVLSGGSLDTSTLGAHSFTVSATDNAGNSSSETHSYTVADLVAPTITLTTPPDGAVYDYGQVVAASYSCKDTGGAGLASCGGAVPSGSPIDTSTLGSHTFTVDAADNAGNAAETHSTYTVVDRIAPTITITSPANGATYQQGAVAYAAYSCADSGGSGLASCAGPVLPGGAIDTAAGGSHTFTVQARDQAGNAGSASVTYFVAAPKPQQCSVEGEGRVGTASFELEAAGRSSAVGYVSFTDRVTRHSLRGNVNTLSCAGGAAQLGGSGRDNSGSSVTFVVRVVDNGARGDTLAVSWPGYTASGVVTSGGIKVRGR